MLLYTSICGHADGPRGQGILGVIRMKTVKGGHLPVGLFGWQGCQARLSHRAPECDGFLAAPCSMNFQMFQIVSNDSGSGTPLRC